MIITFCGHSEIYAETCLKEKILNQIEKIAKGLPVIFYLGDYGAFDIAAKLAALEYKQKVQQSQVVFVTPYMDEKYLKRRNPLKDGYDSIIYPQIETTPKKFAIIERNKWMVKEADYVIAFVKYTWGGAAKTLEYAQNIKKKIFNLADNNKNS